jgi:hypothetical protein
VARGYVTAHNFAGARFVETHVSIAPRVKAVAKSMAAHRQHEELLGYPCHFANSAANAARGAMGETEFAASRCLHLAANKAKHAPWFAPRARDAWANTSDEEEICEAASASCDKDDGVAIVAQSSAHYFAGARIVETHGSIAPRV